MAFAGSWDEEWSLSGVSVIWSLQRVRGDITVFLFLFFFHVIPSRLITNKWEQLRHQKENRKISWKKFAAFDLSIIWMSVTADSESWPEMEVYSIQYIYYTCSWVYLRLPCCCSWVRFSGLESLWVEFVLHVPPWEWWFSCISALWPTAVVHPHLSSAGPWKDKATLQMNGWMNGSTYMSNIYKDLKMIPRSSFWRDIMSPCSSFSCLPWVSYPIRLCGQLHNTSFIFQPCFRIPMWMHDSCCYSNSAACLPLGGWLCKCASVWLGWHCVHHMNPLYLRSRHPYSQLCSNLNQPVKQQAIDHIDTHVRTLTNKAMTE